ncbi:MAG: AzlC family ABC transporter permease [Hydrogenophaga sp.]|nr:AzlC family ABC transporter permease [Hydrogenophaga sp.]
MHAADQVVPETSEATRRQHWREGLVTGLGLGVGAFALAVSFGVAAVAQGWPAWLVVLMSATVFAGGAQFAIVLAFSGGGGVLAAISAATLINLRFVPLAISAARGLRGGRWRRSLEAQSVLDASWATARLPDGSVSREKMIAASLVQWPAWVLGTAIGAYLTPSPALVKQWGLDTLFPAMFLIFVLDIWRVSPRQRPVILVAAVIAGVMCWFVPPGVALLCSGVAGFLALRRNES